MASPSVRVIAHFTVKSEKIDEFIKAARETLVEPSRAEPGCIHYDLWQDAADPTQFAMVEAWESNEALDTHLSLQTVNAAVARLTPMGEGSPKVQRLHSLTGEG